MVARKTRRKKLIPRRMDRRAWILVVGAIAAAVLIISLMYRGSVFAYGAGRFNFVVADRSGDIYFASLDLVERVATVVELPESLHIRSRSVGEYRVGSLVGLSEYAPEKGDFVRRKIQGFFRVPVSGYLILEKDIEKEATGREFVGKVLALSMLGATETNLSIFDRARLGYGLLRSSYRKEDLDSLVKAGVLVEKQGGGFAYSPPRLMAYVDGKFFDWLVGQERKTVAIVDVSGGKGLAQDVADFILNMGADVVLVKEGPGESKSKIVVGSEDDLRSESVRSIGRLLGIELVEVGQMAEYRAEIAVFVGSDLESMF